MFRNYVVEIDTDEGNVAADNLTPGPVIEVWTEGPQGPPGPANFVVSDTDPGLTVPGMWLELLPGGDVTLWIEDGT